MTCVEYTVEGAPAKGESANRLHPGRGTCRFGCPSNDHEAKSLVERGGIGPSPRLQPHNPKETS